MELAFRDKFIGLWEKYFDGAELPIVFYYTNEEGRGELVKSPSSDHQCFIGVLGKVWKGKPLCFGADSLGCTGGKRYLGYAEELRPNFEYFLSCGIEGEMEGERYKKTPEIVKQLMKESPHLEAPGKYIVFKRWDKIEQLDEPEVVIFFAKPDVLSGLFTLTGFEETNREAVIAPFAAGCGSIVLYPYLEIDRDRPRGVLGMFDVSVRPYVLKDTLSFSVPMNKFRSMVDNMEESFLTTESWTKVKKRIKKKI
ncbi:MAG: DUF169 domain-containing protein [Pseudomonadota bacterium]